MENLLIVCTISLYLFPLCKGCQPDLTAIIYQKAGEADGLAGLPTCIKLWAVYQLTRPKDAGGIHKVPHSAHVDADATAGCLAALHYSPHSPGKHLRPALWRY